MGRRPITIFAIIATSVATIACFAELLAQERNDQRRHAVGIFEKCPVTVSFQEFSAGRRE